MDDYDPKADGLGSYNAAIEAKRERGDTHFRRPWKRKEVIGECELYLGDCLTVMRALPNVDAVLTDPPYGIGRDGQKKTTGGNGGRKAYEFKGWDSVRPDLKTFEEILKIAPVQIIWGGNYFADLLPPTGQWLVWDKGQRINQSDGELAWTSRDGALRIFELNRVALLTDGAQHPTQKPVELMNWCLGFLTGCRVIMDPFMGSGTTGVACIKRGHPFIGIEADEEYFDIACDRIRKAYAQPDFFVEQPKQPIGKQDSLFDGDAA